MPDQLIPDSENEVEGKDDGFTDAFKEAGAEKAAQDEEKADAASQDEEKEEKEEKEEPGGEKEEGEKEEKGPAQSVLDERAKRLQEIMTKAKEKGDEKQVQKGKKGPVVEEEGDEEPPEEEEEPEKRTKKEEKEEDEGSGPSPLLKGVKLSKDEQEFVDDMPESVSIMEKIVTKALKQAGKSGATDDIKAIVDAQSDEIATLRTEIVITKLVPDYEDIIFEPGKIDEKGERVPNADFWNWLDKQPDLTKALAKSYNPNDNAAVLNAYKEDRAKRKVGAKDERDRDTLKKVQTIHGYTPTTRKTARRADAEPAEDDFETHFQIASKKAKK